MAKAFDLVHKIAKSEPEESRIPFEGQDDPSGASEPPKKKRPHLEVAFFYILLFIVFFIIGLNFLSPNFIAGLRSKKSLSPSPSPSGPEQGFTIEKDGQPVNEAAKELGVSTPTPSPSPTAASQPTPSEEPSTASTSSAAKIQILNGTNRTGAAAQLRTKLAARGIIVATVGNNDVRSVRSTVVYFKPDYRTAAEQIQAISGGTLKQSSSGMGSYDVIIVIGLN